jgi:hypothetical protein
MRRIAVWRSLQEVDPQILRLLETAAFLFGCCFYRMRADDQENASKIASRYVEYCRREGRKLKAPQNWLRDKGWAGFLEEERNASAAAERGRTMVWVMEGTRAWDAWRSWYEAKGKVPKVAMQVKAEKGFGNYFPTLFPSEAAA